VLASCEVPLSSILEDYALSGDVDEVALAGVENLEYMEGVRKDMFTSAPMEAMGSAFEHLDDKYGGVHRYLDQIGFSFHLQEELRQCVTGRRGSF